MSRLEDLATGTRLTGLAASGTATVESVQWIGEQALRDFEARAVANGEEGEHAAHLRHPEHRANRHTPLATIGSNEHDYFIAD
jgi:hypothetical protein